MNDIRTSLDENENMTYVLNIQGCIKTFASEVVQVTCLPADRDTWKKLEPAEIEVKFGYNSYHDTTMAFIFIRENI